MSFSYDASLSTDKDRARFLMGDRLEAGAIFQDEEITGILTLQPNIFFAVALMATNRAAELSSLGIEYTIGSGVRDAVTVDRRSVPKFWTDLAKRMEQMAITQDGNYEFFDRMAFDIGLDGRDFSDYQGSN